MFKRVLFLSMLMLFAISIFANKPKYGVEEGWTTITNGAYYNNRPLYINNTNAFILTGDKPLLRFAKDDILYGELTFTVDDGKNCVNLCNFDNIKSLYRAGIMKWICKDSSYPNAQIELEVLPVAKGLGAAIKFSSQGFGKNVELRLINRGQKDYNGARLSWDFDVMGHPQLLQWGYNDIDDIENEFPINTNSTAYFAAKLNDSKHLTIEPNAKKIFALATEANKELCSRVKIQTPDPYLDAAAVNSVFAVDGTWYPPVFVHGALQWNNRLPGWRTIFGGTMYGWHDRVAQQAKFYIDSQVTESDKTEPKPSEKLLLTGQDKSSRFYGVGRILEDQDFYDMQTQFFDQIIEDYKWTNAPELLSILRPALELHLTWIKDCFDPDDDGLYESYMNTWPTDSQWYNGGGTAEETSYAYRGHMVALDMAKAAGDMEAAERHQKELDKIKEGFFNRLWIKERGHSGACREQGGYERVHLDPWMYSIFLPIDAELTSPLQNIESLYYSEWALQNDQMPAGGRRVWTSNWLPAAWSVREMWPGDNYHLALSYFQSGLAEDGYDIMRGNYMHNSYNHTVPANLGSDQGGVDFGDCVHTFTRALVSGMFGYRPDYPKGIVTIAPSFPMDWNEASLQVPDYGINYTNDKGLAKYEILLNKQTDMQLRLPILAKKIKSVKVNGKSYAYSLSPMAGRTCVEVYVPNTKKANVTIEYTPTEQKEYYTNINQEVRTNGTFKTNGPILAIYDPQEVFSDINYNDDTVDYILANNSGYHTAIANIMEGECPQWQVIKIKVDDTLSAKLESKKNMEGESLELDWQPCDIESAFNADVRKIYKQKYLSPRPNTVSVRIGVDGFSPWTFPYWGTTPPEISLDEVQKMADDGSFVTPQGVTFNFNGDDNNVAFVSLWDNYPNNLKINIDEDGQVIAFLVCGSTNMMQCNNENAKIIINYEDGNQDIISLMPPVNYWNLCPIDSHASAPGQFSRAYYDSEIDQFCLPAVKPRTVELGENCTAMVLPRKLRKGVKVDNVELDCRAQEVVVGLMGVSIAK